MGMHMLSSSHFRTSIPLPSSHFPSTPTISSVFHLKNACPNCSKRRRIWRISFHAETGLEQSVNRAGCPPVKADIDISAFEAFDLRVGLITEAKPVIDHEISAKRGKSTPSRTHLELRVDIGCEVRTVVSQCKYAMDVEDAVGKKVLFAANIAPQDVFGIKSHGLVLVGLNYDPTPMPRTLRVILPGLGRLPPGAQVLEACIPR